MKYLGQVSQSEEDKELGRHVQEKKKKKRTHRRAVLKGSHQGRTCTGAGLRARAAHLDVINQCDWIAGVRLGLELRRKGPFWGWTDPNRLWQGGYWKQVLVLRSAGEAALHSAALGSGARGKKKRQPTVLHTLTTCSPQRAASCKPRR